MVGAYKLCSALRGILCSGHCTYSATSQPLAIIKQIQIWHKYKEDTCKTDTNTGTCSDGAKTLKQHSGTWNHSAVCSNSWCDTNVIQIQHIREHWQLAMLLIYHPSLTMLCSQCHLEGGSGRWLQYAHTYICCRRRGEGTLWRTLWGTDGARCCQWDTLGNRWKIARFQNVS